MTRSRAPLLLATIASLLSTQSAVASGPHHFAITDVRDTSFTVSWLTTVIEPGLVQLIGGATYPDERGTDFSATTHCPHHRVANELRLFLRDHQRRQKI